MLYFIVNEKSRSGKGAQIWKQVEVELQNRGIDYEAHITEYGGHATLLANKLSRLPDEEIRLIVVGGDGTANEVVNGIVDFEKVIFGMIPTGSGNDLARGLGKLGGPIEELDKILESDGTDRIDLGQVEWKEGEKPRLFLISAGIGLDAMVCKKALTSKLKKVLNAIKLGKLTYIILTLRMLFNMTQAEAVGRYDKKNHKKFPKLIFAAAMNFRAEGGGVPMAPRADARDGKLSVCSIGGIPKIVALFLLPRLVTATHEKVHCVSIVDCDSCEMRLDTPFVLHTDGEYCDDVTEVRFTCLPGKLRILA